MCLYCAVQEEWLKCSAVRQLQNSLGQERQAVFTFYHIFCDEACTEPRTLISAIAIQGKNTSDLHICPCCGNFVLYVRSGD